MEGMFRWAEDMEVVERRIALESRGMSKSDAARATFFRESVSDKAAASSSPELKPTLSFFAAAAAALAVGAQANRDQDGNNIDEDTDMAMDDILSNGGASSRTNSSSSSQSKKARTSQSYQIPNADLNRSSASPNLLFALSEQALDIFEKSCTYDLDFLITLVMQVLYMLHGGKPVVDHRLYPLVSRLSFF